MRVSAKNSSGQCAMASAHIDELPNRRKVESRYDGNALLCSHLLHGRVEHICCVWIGTQKAEQIHPMRMVECRFPVAYRIEKSAPCIPPPALAVHNCSITRGIWNIGTECGPEFRKRKSPF